MHDRSAHQIDDGRVRLAGRRTEGAAARLQEASADAEGAGQDDRANLRRIPALDEHAAPDEHRGLAGGETFTGDASRFPGRIAEDERRPGAESSVEVGSVLRVPAEDHRRLAGRVRLERLDWVLRERAVGGRRRREHDGRHEVPRFGELRDAGAADDALEDVAEGSAGAALGGRREPQEPRAGIAVEDPADRARHGAVALVDDHEIRGRPLPSAM